MDLNTNILAADHKRIICDAYVLKLLKLMKKDAFMSVGRIKSIVIKTLLFYHND